MYSITPIKKSVIVDEPCYFPTNWQLVREIIQSQGFNKHKKILQSKKDGDLCMRFARDKAVSYTHLTLPTKA